MPRWTLLFALALVSCKWIKPGSRDDTGGDGGTTAGDGGTTGGDGGTTGGDGGTTAGDGGTTAGDGGTSSGDGGTTGGDGGTTSGDGGTTECSDDLHPTGEAPLGEVESAEVAVATLYGDGSDDSLGVQVAFVADLDGDCGHELLALGDEAAVRTSDSGGLFLFPSTVEGLVAGVEATASFVPEGVQDFGAVAAVADLDGDGSQDLVASASVSGGAVRIVFGPLDRAADVATLQVAAWAGTDPVSAIAAGNFSGTDAVDVAVGIAGYDDDEDDQGIVLVFEGPFEAGATHSPDYEIAPPPETFGLDSVRFGAGLAVCNLDELGGADLLVGAPGHGDIGDGAVLGFLGPLSSATPPEGDEPDVAYTASGTLWWDFGGAVRCFETSDGPLLLAAESFDSSPYFSVAMFQAPPTSGEQPVDSAADRWITGEVGDHFGASTAVGDIDRDGALDLVVGAPEAADGAGAVYVFYGPWIGEGQVFADDGDWDGQRAIIAADSDGEVLPAALGSAVAVGDLNADGYDDLLLGASGGALGGDAGGGRGVVQVVVGGPRD